LCSNIRAALASDDALSEKEEPPREPAICDVSTLILLLV
jgi:hypothetical protein